MIDAGAAVALLSPLERIDNADAAFLAISNGDVVAPPRMFSKVSADGQIGVMPGASKSLNVFGAKILSLTPANPHRGLPAIQGFVAVFSSDTGTLIALIDGASLTLLRTAAASAAATRRLAIDGATTLGIFGAGAQASAHLDAIAALRPLEDVIVWARNPDKSAAFARRETARTGLRVRASRHPEEAAGSLIVCAVTGAKDPVIRGAWLTPGAHVNLVGAHTPTAREIDTEGMVRGRLFVESRASALLEAGDILVPLKEGAVHAEHIIGEMGDVVQGASQGRTLASDVTIFKSLGHVAQDLFLAAALLGAAKA